MIFTRHDVVLPCRERKIEMNKMEIRSITTARAAVLALMVAISAFAASVTTLS
jgi:hypothetical protein